MSKPKIHGIDSLGRADHVNAEYVLLEDYEKARELIKEMREEIMNVISTASSDIAKAELSYITNYEEMRDLLKKSKDYA